MAKLARIRRWVGGVAAGAVVAATLALAFLLRPAPAVPPAPPGNEWLEETFPDLALAFPPVDFRWVGTDRRPAPGDAMLFSVIPIRDHFYLYYSFFDMLVEAVCGGARKVHCYQQAVLLEDASLAYESAYFDSLETGSSTSVPEQQKGNVPVSPPGPKAEETTDMPRPSGRLLAACAGLTLAACSAVQVRQVDAEWLEDCPAEAHAALQELGLRAGEPHVVTLLNETGRRNRTPFFLKPGPATAEWYGGHPGIELPAEVQQRLKGAMLFGEAKVLGNRMSVHLNRLTLANGQEFPICAVGYSLQLTEPGVERWGPGSHAGVDVGNYQPELLAALADLRPGEFPVPGRDIWISFGTLFRR